MVISVSIEEFKCFKDLRVDLHHLTLFTGYNGAGKSTVIQTLLLLSQSLRVAPSGSAIDLDGPLVHLGNAVDVARFGGQPTVSLYVKQGQISGLWRLVAERRARYLRIEQSVFTDEKSVEMTSTRVAAPDGHAAEGLCDSIRNLTFLGASRLFSTNAWPSPPLTIPYGDVGKSGEFAPFWHFQTADDEVASGRRHPDEQRTTVRGQVDAYLGQLFPGAEANTDQLPGVDLFRLELRLGKSNWIRPGNIGFGLTYVFPLIVALVTAQDGQLVIVDSPEAHLHPRAQSELGKIVARFAAAGVRVIVETHSDHFLNGVRLAIQQQIISHKQTAIYFFGGSSEDNHGVRRLNVDPAGEIDSWPQGFFDQAESDLSQLLGLGK